MGVLHQAARAGDVQYRPMVSGATPAGPQKMFKKFATNLCELHKTPP
jgi:hypothetical protein